MKQGSSDDLQRLPDIEELIVRDCWFYYVVVEQPCPELGRQRLPSRKIHHPSLVGEGWWTVYAAMRWRQLPLLL